MIQSISVQLIVKACTAANGFVSFALNDDVTADTY